MSLLPEYERPPVVEVVLAVEFTPLPGWNPILYGSLWEHFRKEYPLTEVQLLAAALEPAPQPDGSTLVLSEPPLRYFFKKPDSSELIQVRSGAFIRNWRSIPGSSYPRYRQIRPAFEHDFKAFLSYLRGNGFPPPEVWKCEVTYVNHFYKGREWSDWSEVPNLVPGLAPSAKPSMLSSPRQMQCICTYELLRGEGRLLVNLLPGISTTGDELVQFSLSASGKPASSSVEHLMEWMDKGREAVVSSFSELTSVTAQNELWGRIWQ